MTLRLSDRAARKLKKWAAMRRVPPSRVLRDYIDSLPIPEKGEPSLYDKMKNLIGRTDSGVTDKSTNPKHMKGFGKWRS